MSPDNPSLPPTPQQLAMAEATKSKPWELIFRLINFGLILLSLALAWWTFEKRLIPQQQKSRQLASTMDTLSSQIDDLSRKWPKFERDQIRTDYKEVRSALFQDEMELGRWVMRLEEEAAPLALETQVKFGSPSDKTTDKEKLSIIPASITLVVRPTIGGTQTPYQRMLRLGQTLGAEGKRADLAELTVNGGPLSITKGILVFNLWAGDENTK